MDAAADRRKPGEAPETSPWEWGVAGLGLMIVAGLAGYLTWYGLTRPQGPPDLILEPIGTIRSTAGYLLHVRVRNDGYSTAAAVTIVGELEIGPSSVEEGEATLDYAPERSEREVWLAFTQDPGMGRVQLRVKGFAKP